MSTNVTDLKANERYSIQNGVASTIVANLSANYFPLFAISVLGATNYQVGLISSLPQFIGMFAMVIGSIILSKLSLKKNFTAWSIFYTRLFVFAMVFVVYVPNEYQSWVFVILIGLMNLPGSFANLSWQSFIGDLIPDERRSAFFSERNRMLTLIGMITTLVIGVILQQFDKSNALPYQFLFAFAFGFGLLEVYYLTKHIEPSKQPSQRKKVSKWGLDVFRHKPYVVFLLCALFFNFAWQMAWSLFNIYNIKYAHATGFWISLFAVSGSLGQIISYKWWGRMTDKYSNAKMFILVCIGMAISPILTIMSTNLIYLTIVYGISGLFVSGTLLILFNQLLEVTEANNRSSYIANYNILLALIGFIAPQVGVYFLETASMTVAMSISSSLRLISGAAFLLLYLYLKKYKVDRLDIS